MSIDCVLSHSGGKGNRGMFIERNPRVCAAGLASAQPHDSVAGCLRQYLLQDEVNALLGDAIKPDPNPIRLPPLRRTMTRDMGHAGSFGEGPALFNPPIKTKFQCLADDFKNTVYRSYWNKPVGQVKDPAPMLPAGMDVNKTTFGKKNPFYGHLYDIVMPIDPVPDKTRKEQEVCYQVDRNYCRPAFSPESVLGMRYNVDQRGRFMKCCLTDDRLTLGTALKTRMGTIQANFLEATQPKLGTCLTPNNNIDNVPKGYAFGVSTPKDSVVECMTNCEINQGREFFKKCLAHLNSVRKFLKKRYESTIFQHLVLGLVRYDKDHTGWLPKEVVYDFCTKRYIKFNPNLIEPLLCQWKAFDGKTVEYKTLVLALNFTLPTAELPRIWDIPDDCIDFRTTYSEMAKPYKKKRIPRAGVPSGRYFDVDYPVTPDGCCKASRAYLPHESDMKCCLSQSIFTTLGVSHRDMYAKREKDIVKRVFEATDETFPEDSFDKIWQRAVKYHSKGWVCFETFRRALKEFREDSNGV